MKKDIKDGKNVSLDGITVINEGISLAEKVEKNVVEEQPAVVAPVAPPVEEENNLSAPEITPDVVVGGNNVENSENVVPFPVPGVVENNQDTLPNINIPTPPIGVVPNVANNVVSFPVPGVVENNQDFLSDVKFPTPTNVVTPNFGDSALSSQIPANNLQPNIDISIPSYQSAMDNNVPFYQTPSYVTENNFSSFVNNSPLVSENKVNSFGNEQSVNFDSASSLNNLQNEEDLPAGVHSILTTLESIGRDYVNMRKEAKQKDLELKTLRNENDQLKIYVKDLENQISNLKNNIVNMQSRVLGMFGMGDMAGNIQNNNQYGNFNDSKPNNFNIAA